MDPSRATSFGLVSSKEHHLPKKQSSIHVHCSQPDAHSLQEHLGKQCHVDQLKGKDNPCSTLATQASHTNQRSSTKVEYNKQNSTPSHEHIRKRCLTNMEASAPDATSPQQHTIKWQISNIEQQNFTPVKMEPHKIEHKKGQQMDSSKQHNPNAHSTKQQNPNPRPHTSKSQLQPLKQQTTPSSRHAPQTSHSSHSLSSRPPKPSTILDLCTQRVGYMFEGDILAVYGPAKYTNT
ncbi:uncharacterized protein LOC131050273 isoform X1 [Cryptomeria japonica]|uniref:uncharacterized protein LOC131050273 isoform X1 n=1 Tax=Cryptomeria japonica TaxID=3369 RepID=UPI0027D9EE35|nr:uncharacterized protein LOC131050273 isoform X1 [Cryptomeria japonica]